MKVGLLIQDLTAEQAVDLIGKLPVGVGSVGITGIEEKPGVYDAEIKNPASLPSTKLPPPAGLSSAETTQTPPAEGERKVAPKQVPGEGVDVDGLPWDERIHAGSKTKNKDGRWKKKKGVQPAQFDEIAAELKGAQTSDAINPPAAPPAAPPAPPVAPPPPAAAPPAAPPVEEKPSRDFQGLMQQISNLFANKSITPDYPPTIVSRVNEGFGVSLASISDVANDARMVEYAWQCLEVDGKAA